MSDELEGVSPLVNPATRYLKRERDICSICGGFTGKHTLVRRLPAMDSEGVPYPLAPVPPVKLCPGHPEPAPKHDGNLPGRNPYTVKIIEIMGIVRDVRIGHDQAFVEKYGASDEVWLSAAQFLSLMDWGEQNREAIQRLAKEQETSLRDDNTKAGEE